MVGLSAASLAHWPRSALAQPAAQEHGHLDDIRVRIIDSACDLTNHAEGMRLAGINTVIRYYAHGPGQWAGKVLTKTELDVLEAQNLSVAVVFQNNNNVPENFLKENKKVEDVMWARTHADHLQQPEGTPIYFGVDFDLRHWDGKKSDSNVTEQRIAAIKRYFEYAREELAKDGRKLGAYGCGKTCEVLEGIADYFWLSSSADYWRSGEFYNSGEWHLFQNRVNLTRFYGDSKACPIDTNLANPNHEDFGQWRRDGVPDVDVREISQQVLDARSFVAVQQLWLYKAHPQHDRTPLKPAELSPSERTALRYAFNVKILSEEGDYYGVCLDESDMVRGWCHRSDLSADGRMPLKADRTRALRSAGAEPPAPRPANAAAKRKVQARPSGGAKPSNAG